MRTHKQNGHLISWGATTADKWIFVRNLCRRVVTPVEELKDDGQGSGWAGEWWGWRVRRLLEFFEAEM